MNTLWIVILSVLTIYLAYNLYAKRIDRNVIQPDAKRATPARMYIVPVANLIRLANSSESGEASVQ